MELYAGQMRASELTSLASIDLHLCLLQVWRPIIGPVEESPLAFVPANSINQDDLIYGRLLYPDKEDSSFYSMKYNPGKCRSIYHGFLTEFTADDCLQGCLDQ